MQITLSLELEKALIQRAQQVGIAPDQLATDLLRQQLNGLQFDPPVHEEMRAKTLADFLEGYIGVIQSGKGLNGGAGLSEKTGKNFARLMMQKRQKGHL